MKVFLGGTCNNTDWRSKLIRMLKIGYYNPVVADWIPDCMAEEIKQRKECDYCLYVITPKMTGVYSIAEVIDDSNKRPEKTIFCYLKQDNEFEFDEFQVKSLTQVGQMVKENGGTWLNSLSEVAHYLNTK